MAVIHAIQRCHLSTLPSRRWAGTHYNLLDIIHLPNPHSHAQLTTLSKGVQRPSYLLKEMKWTGSTDYLKFFQQGPT